MGLSDWWRRWASRTNDTPVLGSIRPPAPAPAPVPAPEPLPRIPAAENPLGIDLLDLRPITATVMATSTDPQMATNAASYGGEDGLCFVGREPEAQRTDTDLRYPIDGVLADGVLFNPPDMDHKWALYVHGGRILFVRSWLREVQAIADFRHEDGVVVVDRITGSFGPDPDPEGTIRTVDWLLRSHALGEPWPIPFPAPEQPEIHRPFALAAFSAFGRRATVAAFGPPPEARPGRPLRTSSMLHVAVARADTDALRAEIARGTPPDLRGSDGLTPLHWAMSVPGTAVPAELLALGAAVDGRSDEGATPLMQACQLPERDDAIRFLLDRGADPNARDVRGFTALHRAAETGRLEAVRLLLAAGADPAIEASGHTAIALAELREQPEIVAALARP